MNNKNKGKAKYTLASMVMLLFITVTFGNRYNGANKDQFYKTLTTDTIPHIRGDSAKPKRPATTASHDTVPFGITDSLHHPGDSLTTVVDTFNFKVSKD